MIPGGDLESITGALWITAGVVAGLQITYRIYRQSHPIEDEEIFIDPRPSNPKLEFEGFMNFLGYQKGAKIYNKESRQFLQYSPLPNPNPNTVFGRFASRNNYFKK